ncbi:MAG: HupE/UreJ family protein, partial [Pseudomonadota bacterium]|nr:HupE/UreJ family protein [Pseudomonadota bacterium]
HAAAASPFEFLLEGVRHILTGYDHVLFLLCLLLPSVMRRTPDGWRPVERLPQAIWPIVGIVSAFTVAHSITLGLAALKLVSLSPALIEPGIAVTIILAALDNVLPIFPVRRVVVTFFFGLIHGFGFANVLAELNLPRAAFAWVLLQFNVGLELGQLMIVAVAATTLFTLRRWPGYARAVIGGGSSAAIVIGLLWLIERTANVSLMPF